MLTQEMWHKKRERRRRLTSRHVLKLFLLVVFTIAIIFLAPLNTSYLLQIPSLPPPRHLTKYVNPLIGTGGQGHTYPGATVPFGMVQLSPDNGEEGWKYSSGYHYNASTITGFSHTHLSGTGIGDLLDISVQPTTKFVNKANFRENWTVYLKHTFNHSNEVAEPGYYRVVMGSGVQVEVTATNRTGMHRYTFHRPSSTATTTTSPTAATTTQKNSISGHTSAANSRYIPGVVLNLCIAMNFDVLQSSMIEVTDITTTAANRDGGNDGDGKDSNGNKEERKNNPSTTQTTRTLITGYRMSTGWAEDHQVYFAMEFSLPIKTVSFSEDATEKKIKKGAKRVAQGRYTSAYFTFEDIEEYFTNNSSRNSADNEEEKPLVVLLKVGLSSVSVKGALENLQYENPNWDFDAVREAATASWESELSKIIVQGGDEEAKMIFYTSLYHTKMAPTLHSDINGGYRGPDSEVHRVVVSDGSKNDIKSILLESFSKGVSSIVGADADNGAGDLTAPAGSEVEFKSGSNSFPYYSTFSIWDTFRAAHPLLTILNPDRVKDMMRTFLAHADHHGGVLPFWPLFAQETRTMPGYHAAVMLAEAATKNLLSKKDLKRAFKAMKLTAMDVERGGLFMHKFGFVPANKKHESVTVTLELSYDDWCIAQIAEKLNDHKQALYFYNRSKGYERVFDPETQFMRAKFQNNTWKTPFNPRESEHAEGDYTEGTAWQHLWFVPHDIPRLIQLFNGSNNFEAKLDALFHESSMVDGQWASNDISGLIGQYAHGNEPSHHVAYLYNYVDAPQKTQARVRGILKDMYQQVPDGIVGNEDCGQMSAWYIFSALGFYPVNPAEAKYQLGSPLFDHAVIDVGQGKKFEVKAIGAGTRGDVFVKKVRLNGQILDRWYITHDEIMNGGVLELEMSSEMI